MKISEFREYLTIDQHALDEAVIRQPSLFYEVSEACSLAVATRDQMLEDLAIVDAVLDGDIRAKQPSAKEAQIKASIKRDFKHQGAFGKWLQAKERAERLTALKDAFKQRAQSLRLLADLYAANYYDGASIKTNAAQDQVVYHSTRAKLAKKRGEKHG